MANGKYDITKDQSQPGDRQIKNPFLRTAATIGDALLSTFAPRAAAVIPGNATHHAALVNNAENAVEGEINQREEARKEAAAPVALADTESQTALRNAQAKKALESPEKVKDEELLYDKNGTPIGYRDAAGKYYGPEDAALPQGVRDVLAAAKTKEPKEAAPHFEKGEDGTIYAFSPQPDGSMKKDVLVQGTGAGKKPQLTAVERGYMKSAGGDPDKEETWTPAVMTKYRDLSTQRIQMPPVEHGQDYVVPDGKGGRTMVHIMPGQSVPEGAQTAQGVNAVSTPTMQQRTAAGRAQTVHEMMPEVINDINGMKDKIGKISGRWNEFMQGKIGMEDPEFAGLRADLMMTSTAVALAHAQGRLPEGLRQEFEHMINSPKQSAGNLVAILQKIDPWLGKQIEQGGVKSTTNATPARPKGVPPEATYDAAKKQWVAP